MGQAIGEILPFAAGVALSPVPIIAVILMLVTPRACERPGLRRGLADGPRGRGRGRPPRRRPADANDDGEPATWADGLKLVLGGLLVLVALRQWRGRPRDEEEAPTPRWMGAIDAFTPLRALGAGAVLAGANPKNLLLAVGAAATIAQTGIPGGEQAAAYAIFAVIGTVGVGAPVAIYFAMGDRARPILDRLRTWMGHNNAVIMAVLCLVIGAKLVGDAIAGLS